MPKLVNPFVIGLVLTAVSLACVEPEIESAQPELLAADTPKTTVMGNPFMAPEGWTFSVRGPATILEAPEGGSWVALVDAQAEDAEAALAAGWAAYKEVEWPLKVTNDSPDKDGWSNRRRYEYQTSPNERRTVLAGVMFAGESWTVWIYDMDHAVGEKRGAQVSLIFDRLLPKGYSRETFAGKEANQLDEARIAALAKFVEDGQQATGVPGVSVGIVQDGKVVFAGGFGIRELGAAYDKAMQTVVFDPLGMTATTFDYDRALEGNFANAHAPDIDGNPAIAVFDLNYSVIPLRPAGAGWSSVSDMLKYIAMELDEGTLPNGERYISSETLLERRAEKVPIGNDAVYGMGLIVDTTYGIPVVQHGGDMVGYHSDMMWLPDHDVGAVILTNGDPGWLIRSRFQRKLLEVLFDGQPEADADLAADSERFLEGMAAERKLLTVPADAAAAGELATQYSNSALGEIAVSHVGATTVFDFGEWKSEVASRHNPDDTVSFLTIAPGMNGFEFVVGSDTNRTLVLRDAQHEYVFEEQ